MSKIYIIRYGQIDWDVKKILQGVTNIELNETGKQKNLTYLDGVWYKYIE